MAETCRQRCCESCSITDNLVPRRAVKVGMLTFLLSEVAFFGTLIMTYVHFLHQTTHGEPKSEPGVSLTDGSGRLGVPVLQQRDDLPGGESSAPQFTADVSRLVGSDHRAGRLVPLGHNARVERSDWQVGIDHQPQFVREHVFHSGRIPCLARDHWGDRHEYCVRPGAAPADHGRNRPVWKSSPGTGTLWMVFGWWSLPWCMSWDVESNLKFQERILNSPDQFSRETRRMTRISDRSSDRRIPPDPEGLEMPRATAWPIVLALGLTLLGAGLATSLVLSVVGAVLFVFGLGGWIGHLLPGRGHGTNHWSSRHFVPSLSSKSPVRWSIFVPVWPVIDSGFPKRFTPFPPESRVASWVAW